MSVGSGIDRPASWLIGIFEPYASTITPSRIVTDARPVRTPDKLVAHVFERGVHALGGFDVQTLQIIHIHYYSLGAPPAVAYAPDLVSTGFLLSPGIMR